MFIDAARAFAVPGQIGKLLDRDFVGDLEGKLEIRRHLGHESTQILAVRESIVCGVDADRLEHLRIFSQTTLLKARLCEFPPINIPRFIVQHPPPTGIFPRRCADENPTGGQFSHLGLYVLAIKRHP